MIHLTDDGVPFVAIRGDADAGDLQGNTGLHWAANNGHHDCVSFLVNFGVNLWSLNNDLQTAKDLAAISADRQTLDMLDQAMARHSALNPKSVRKMREKALMEAERRIRAAEKLHKKALKKAEKEEKEMERKRRKLLSLPASPANASTPATTSKQPFTRSSTAKISPDLQTSKSVKHMHLFESKSGPKTAALKFSDIVSQGTMRSAPKSSSLGVVSRKILHKKLHSHHSMNNLSHIGDNVSSAIVPDVGHKLDSGYFSKSSVRSLSGLRRDADVLFGVKEGRYENIYHSMNSLSLKNSSWIEMFRQKEDP